MPEEAEIVAVASPTAGHAAGFATRHGIPRAYTDHREAAARPAVELIWIAAPIGCTRRSRSTPPRPASMGVREAAVPDDRGKRTR